MEKVAAKRRRRGREALLELALAQCRVDQAGHEVDGVITVETVEAQTETAKGQIEDDHDPKEIEDHIAAMEAATDLAPEAEDGEGREVGTTHEIQEEDGSMEKRKSKDAADPKIVAI